MYRFVREPHTEAGRYYTRALKRRRAKIEEVERIRREAREKAEREQLAQERIKREQAADADGESDDEKDELKKFQKRVCIIRGLICTVITLLYCVVVGCYDNPLSIV